MAHRRSAPPPAAAASADDTAPPDSATATRRLSLVRQDQPASSTVQSGPRHRRTVAVLTLVLAAAAALVVVLLIRASSGNGTPTAHGSSSSASRPRPVRTESPVAQAASWVVEDLPSSAPVFTDQATARRLLDAGRAAVQTDPSAWRSADYVLDTPPLRAEARSSKELRAALASEVPAARFGSGNGRVIVARLLPGGSADAFAAVRSDAADRAAADAELLRNGRVRIAQQARSAFRSGAVDLRAATLIAMVAQSQDVRVMGVARVPAEDAAGLPIRRLSLSFRNRSALADALAVLPAGYRPESVTGSSVVRVTWAVQLPPLLSVH
jgi:hypothetical protein